MNRRAFLKHAGLAGAAGSLGMFSPKRPDDPASSSGHADQEALAPIWPKPLREGDRIGVVAPAGRILDPSVFGTIERTFAGFGLDVVFGPSARAAYGYLSGPDELRADDLMSMFRDPSIDGILALRGGWGSNRILPLLDFDAIRDHPKLLCGYSDITSLHLALSSRSGLVSFHGPNSNSEFTPWTRSHFQDVVFARKSGMVLEPMAGTRSECIHPGIAEGRILGGNLTVLTSLLGTPYMPDLRGAILFLEDIGEDVYRMDRMLSQLQLSGTLSTLSGFIFGQCLDCDESTPHSLSLDDVIRHYVEGMGIPAFQGTMISHMKDIFTIPVGWKGRIDAEAFTLSFDIPV